MSPFGLFPEHDDRLASLMVKTGLHALKAARRAESVAQGIIGRVVDDPTNLSREESQSLLELFSGPPGAPAHHLGDPAIAADVIVHAEIEAFVRDFWPKVIVGGEEALDDLTDVLAAAPDGTLALNVDPIDGSRLYETFGFGWCVALQLLIKTGHSWRNEFILLVGDNGRYISADRNWLVQAGDAFDSEIEPEVVTHLGARGEDARPSLAIVAAKAEDRRLFSPLTSVPLPDWSIDTMGGNTIARGFAKGGLCASLTLKACTTWDTCWIPMIASLGASVTKLDGEIVPLNKLRDWWDYIGFGLESKIIPPLLVSRPEYRDELLRAIESVGLVSWVERMTFGADDQNSLGRPSPNLL